MIQGLLSGIRIAMKPSWVKETMVFTEMNKAKDKQILIGILKLLMYPLVWVACYLLSRLFDLDRDKSALILFSLVAVLLSGYTVFKFKMLDASKRRELVLANLIVAGISILFFLKAFLIDPKPEIIAVASMYVLGFIICIPSIISIPFFLLALLGKPINPKVRFIESPFQTQWLNKIALKFVSLLGLFISLLFMAVPIVVFRFKIELSPFPWIFVAVAFYGSYWACLASVIGLKENVSSRNIFYQAFVELYRTLAGQPVKKP